LSSKTAFSSSPFSEERTARFADLEPETFPMKCIECKGSAFESTPFVDEICVGDRVFTVTLSAHRCVACGEMQIPGDEVGRAELAAARALAEAGEVSGESFKFIRHALGFTAAALAEELGVNVKTISRWEKGDGAVDTLAWLAVTGLVADTIDGRTTTHDRLRAVRERPGLARAVRLDSLPPVTASAGK
jgi:DNA-binding XRE family transcriptional regulator